jgi:N-acetylglutamate synthase-like GNAT family acetyltransferase
MDLVIRSYKPEDDEAVKRIRSEIEQVPLDQEINKIEESYFVADHNGEVVGYMHSYISSGGFGMEKSAWISMIGVEPNYMGEGIGKRLAEQALIYYKAQGIRNVYASVSWDSTDILSFFKTLGFDRSDFINLKKSLDNEA